MQKKKLQVIGTILALQDKKLLAKKVVGNTEDYQNFFRGKMKKFGVTQLSEITPEQWEEIDKEWKTKKETD